MAAESAAQTDGDNNELIRKPNNLLWIGTALVIVYAVWCILLLSLTASGHLVDSRNFGCIDAEKDFMTSRLKEEAELVYLWAGLSLPVCILLLLEFWRRKGYYTTALLVAALVLSVIMCLTFYYFAKKETQAILEFQQSFKNLTLQTPRHRPENTSDGFPDTACHILEVHRWQAEFKCCGLKGYQDWGLTIPDSCLCEGDGNSSGCVEVGRSFFYEKPCLPTVLSLVEKRSSTFWVVMITWIVLTAFPVLCGAVTLAYFICMLFYIMVLYDCCENLYMWIPKTPGEEFIPVVFIKNNQTEEEVRESSCEGRAHVVGGGPKAGDKDFDDNTMNMIPLSQLRRLQEELDPPPSQHQVLCRCIIDNKIGTFYTILIDAGSPLLPSDAVLVDANKPCSTCLWAKGHHLFCVEDIVWPKDRNPHSGLLLS